MMVGMNFQKYFKDKKITVMGLGLLGRGVGDVEYLAEAGAELIVTDLKTEAQLRSSLEKLKHFSNITYRLGGHQNEDFENRDMVLVAAGVPIDSPYLSHAREAGVRLVQSAALFAEVSNVPIIGVTGTRGKTTTTQMIHHVLSIVTGETVLLGGNIRGVSNLQLLKEVTEESLCVMELDSWQLQGFGWAEISPQIAVFTTFMEDHLNYYWKEGMSKEEAMDRYFLDKANIFRWQEESDVFITTPAVFARAKNLTGVTIGQEVVLVDASLIPEDATLATPGEHNRLNAALATAALKAVSLPEAEIFEALASFPGVEGRLQFLSEHNGVKIYNDNNATEPNATIAALRAVGNADQKNVVLLAGGADKQVDLSPLIEEIGRSCRAVVLLEGTGTQKLISQIEAEVYDDLEAAVHAGLALCEPGDVFLFSPAFASFGMFENEYDRNDQFVDIVKKITD